MAGNQTGRKNSWYTKIEPRLLEIEAWARDGLTDKQMCQLLGVSPAVFYKYKAQHQEFQDALKRTKELADIEVENSLNKRAKGFTYEEVHVEEKCDIYGNVIETKTKKIIKTVVPDTTAQIFWLKNRKPDKWRDKHETELSGTVGVSNVDPEKYLKEKGIPLPIADDMEDIIEDVVDDIGDV